MVELKQCILSGNQGLEEAVWKTTQLFSRYTFTTKKGEKFRYIINKGAVCVLGKDVDITRNTVNVAVSMVIDKGKLSETEWLRCKRLVFGYLDIRRFLTHNDRR